MRKINNLILLIMIAVFFSGCGPGSGSEIEAPGIVDGNIITLKSQVVGIVEQFAVREGEIVEQGTIIARIGSDKIENQLKEVEIALKEIAINREKALKKSTLSDENLKFLRKQVNRFRRLEKNRSLAGEKVENMELRLLEAETSAFDLQKTLESLDVQKERAQNKKEYLGLLLKDHHIAAPAAGVIVEQFISAGENVFPNSAIVDILDTSSLFVEVFIEEVEISALKLNQRAAIIVDGLEDEDISGVISYFGKKAEFSPKYIISEKERKALLYRVKIRADKGSAHLKVGMPVTVRFKRAENPGE
ncbi:MAG: efflux RND transporter periplasmic adaptor subunit [Candidatus Aminicenantes bacterium]|nr:efflux RND transporter periplasmic adaptor subunit [Candidatus Aminicenantes bacterium]